MHCVKGSLASAQGQHRNAAEPCLRGNYTILQLQEQKSISERWYFTQATEKREKWPGMAAPACNSVTWEAAWEELREFKVSLGCMLSSKPTWTTQ